jgi:hypothetical protein
MKIPQLIAKVLNIDESKIRVAKPSDLEKPIDTSTLNKDVPKFDKDSYDKMQQTKREDSDKSDETSNEVNTKKIQTPVVSNFRFDGTVNAAHQPIITNVVNNLNTILRLPDFGLFAEDEIEGKTDSVILVEKIIDDDGERRNPPKEIHINPFIQIVE